MVRRELFQQAQVGAVGRKMNAYALESGRNSLTRQFSDMGLRAVVVDRDGALYREEGWAQSHTLWQADQEKLLIADNQTRIYANGSLDRRRLLSALAWGSQADPRGPSAQQSAQVGSR